ncbi:MAG: glycosyltransferase [Flavobacterium sp.]|nr:glycosyltransferase [Flavobacterium sp.]
MRILQLIDSLDAGGAEKMAVNYANALAATIEFSALAVSRREGPLLGEINENVGYLFLKKKKVVDFSAISILKKYIKDHEIQIIHAHGTSFFLAFLIKLCFPSIKLIWHDHYGDSEFLNKRPLFLLKRLMPFFFGIIVVNQQLKVWAEESLRFKNVIWLPNFAVLDDNAMQITKLHGNEGKRIVCLANLRTQKDHFLLLEVAAKLKGTHSGWTFHLVGKDFEDAYSKAIKTTINDLGLQQHVFMYGTRTDVKNILSQSEIGILTSKSEGLPVALLEYGLCKKAIVVTAVGEIQKIIIPNDNGISVTPGRSDLFYEALVGLIDNQNARILMAEKLHTTILEGFSINAVLNRYISWINFIND